MESRSVMKKKIHSQNNQSRGSHHETNEFFCCLLFMAFFFLPTHASDLSAYPQRKGNVFAGSWCTTVFFPFEGGSEEGCCWNGSMSTSSNNSNLSRTSKSKGMDSIHVPIQCESHRSYPTPHVTEHHVTLRSYQRQALHWMMERERHVNTKTSHEFQWQL